MNVITTVRRVMDAEIAGITGVEAQLKYNQDEYERVIEAIYNLNGRLIFTGVGKSGHIGEKLAATFASTGTPSFFVHATEAMHGDLGMITPADLVVVISNSGETKESVNVLDAIHRLGVHIVALTGNAESTLAKRSDYLLEVHVDGEADKHNLAPTKSSTAALVVGDALAVTISEMKGLTETEFGTYHPGGALGQRLLKKGVLK